MPKDQHVIVVTLNINPEDPLFWSIINDLVDYIGDETLIDEVIEFVAQEANSQYVPNSLAVDTSFVSELEREIIQHHYTKKPPLSDDDV